MKNIKNNQVKDLKTDTIKSPRNINKIKVALLSTLFLLVVLGGYKAIQFSYNYFHSHTYIKLNVEFKVELPKMITNEEYQRQLDQEKQVDEMSKKAVELLKKESSFNLVKPVQAIDTPYCYDAISCIRDVGEEMGFSNSNILTMIKIAKCESGYREDAINKNTNGTIDRGIFQLNSIHKNISNADAFTFESNIKYAWNMFKAQGTNPWNSSIKCWSN
jgi:hypothetical protein